MWASPGVDVSESRRRCGRVPCRCGRSPRTDVGAVPVQTWGRPLGRQWRIQVQMWTNSVYPSPKPLHVRVCARVRARACAPALVWLPFYPYMELASLLPLCVCAHVPGGSCVSGSAYVRACVRARATARACNSGDGRGVGRSRTASERGYVRWATPVQPDMCAWAGSKLMLA